MRLITCAVLASALLLSSAPLRAQDDQQESVAEAARKAQEAKKANPQSTKVFTNDDIESLKGDISIVGEEPAPPADQTKAAAPADKTPAKGEAYWRKAFADARRSLADDEKELDVLQREYNLKEEQYYSDPNQALREQTDRKDLTDTKAQIDEKTAAVEKDKQAISDLQDQLRQSGGEPGWADPPDSSSSSSSSSSDTSATDSTQSSSQPSQSSSDSGTAQPATPPASTDSSAPASTDTSTSPQ